MRQAGFIMLLVVLIGGCSSEPKRPPVEKPVDLPAMEQEYVVSKDDLLLKLETAGLKPETRPAKPLPARAQVATSADPLQTFMLVVNDEGWWAIEYSSNTYAQEMASQSNGGFRYMNWYFLGMVSINTTNQVKQALMGESSDD